MHYSERLGDALAYAARIHRGQRRKEGSIPYLAHPLAVCALVAESGGNEDQMIAALLHDGPEEAGGLACLQEIRQRFGDKVAELIDWCTDTYEKPEPPWYPRKKAYLVRLQSAPPEALLIVVADKVHNVRSLVQLLRREGLACFQRFRGGQEGTLWYYREMVRLFRQRLPECELTDELTRLVEELFRRIENPPMRFQTPVDTPPAT
ncbi:MAG: HD domain-containing protein [Gemmatales bacterium]|nr:HD domain-containing protein [Gemmatales bacterium]MDW8223266.1 HD domain-containing protein [Gemmatales bacterium]